MAIREVLGIGDERLRKKCHTVTDFGERLFFMLDDLHDTLKDQNGAGLAAPQIGIMRRICLVMDAEENVLELINPEIIFEEGEQEGSEGCLSFPGRYGIVKRPYHVVVKAQNRFGEWIEHDGTLLTARAFCHEIDHLNGKLYTDIVIRMIDPDEEAEGE